MTRTHLCTKALLKAETGVIQKNWKGRLRVALIYPNTYQVGMANLGFQTVYRLINQMDDVVCERIFLPADFRQNNNSITSIESGHILPAFDILAFSVSFETDYINIVRMLRMGGIAPESEDRQPSDPFVMAGGVACMLNPEPIANFIDCFLIGEAEAVIFDFFKCYKIAFATDLSNDQDRQKADSDKKFQNLETIAKNVTSAYVPRLYSPEYNQEGRISAYKPLCSGLPETIVKTHVPDLCKSPVASTTIFTQNTSFANTYLIETGRGCPHGCRFCSAGYIYRPPRFHDIDSLDKCIRDSEKISNNIGLVGAAVSDLPGISDLCSRFSNHDLRFSFSSLRADALTPPLINALAQSRVKTATIAPDAGSERMRRVINKGISEDDIIKATYALVTAGIFNLKLYFMIGLPKETDEDILAIIKLCKKIKEVFLSSSRKKKRIGEITVSLNSFVPKPVTPFQWVGMDTVESLNKKIKTIKKGLAPISNIRFHADAPRKARIQALLSRGDRRVSDILLMAEQNRDNWPQTLKQSDLDIDSYIHRQRDPDEFFPWDIIDHKVKKSFLYDEYLRADAEKAFVSCKMNDCNICGACKKM